ncbi:MAG TPA: ABC transporter ATP-binding protein [Syntrophorhabdaceae bacterium]|nr:ABC transporter ATP-binding protein [Syntrophorhabdaceae bacterium]HOT42208.1 ABC transporter ATP-binding protein [Syntrophorhabdaceae bacterium]HPC66007.1 ABC transporter ATP-binding protein [Syntrophorhabdaceae bacterium]HQE79179.1 ABC transporter ATP-binding protein [Syntrophorhabdaceae bacterium]HQH42368.1 ABC transporter ATP-binding protein [Syntrophorhabdaceae bacterium]
MKILEVRDLEKSFGGVKAVDRISFHIEEGEVFSVIGPNGAGKTTMFNLITGLYRPDNGRIIFLNRDITKTPTYMLIHFGIARTFQNMRLFSNLTVLENVMSSLLSKKTYNLFSAVFRTKRYATSEKTAEEKARGFIDFFGLSGKEDYTASSLSYGEQRRLELARALSTQPRLLLIDEPGAGMNPKEISDLAETIKTIRQRYSVTIAIIEHQMNLVMNISDRIMVMDFGEKIMEGTPQEVKKDKRVIEAYLGEEME